MYQYKKHKYEKHESEKYKSKKYKKGKNDFQPRGLTGVFFFIVFSLLPVISATANANEEKAVDNPRYSRLFDQLEQYEKDNKPLKALKLIPEIYAAEDIPVDSFYTTLDRKRIKLLEKMTTQQSACGKLAKPFSNLIDKVSVYRFKTAVINDLPFERFCYLMAIKGKMKAPGRDSSATEFRQLSKSDLKQALNSSDPWLVSSALFYARKNHSGKLLANKKKKNKKPSITPQAVIKRWQKRPDLWDEQCTQQALLFLAQLDPKSLKKLKISNEDISLALDELKRVPSTKSYLSPLLYSAVDNQFNYIDNPNITLIKLEKDKQKKGVIKRWAGDKNQLLNLKIVDEKKISADDYDDDGALPVKPGFYKIDFNSVEGDPPSGFYGKSALIDVKAGRFIIVPVAAFPAI